MSLLQRRLQKELDTAKQRAETEDEIHRQRNLDFVKMQESSGERLENVRLKV